MINKIVLLRAFAVILSILFYSWLFLISKLKLFETIILILAWGITIKSTYTYFKLLMEKR